MGSVWGKSQADCSPSEPWIRYLNPGIECRTARLLEVFLGLEHDLICFSCLKCDASFRSGGGKEIEAATVLVSDPGASRESAFNEHRISHPVARPRNVATSGASTDCSDFWR